MNNYIIIPNKIKIDNKIPSGAKILYGEILSLSLSKGFCFATNEYLSELYGVHCNSVTNWIKSLKKAEYISVKYMKHSGRSVRTIYPNEYCGSKKKKSSYFNKLYKKRGKDKTKTKTKTKVVI